MKLLVGLGNPGAEYDGHRHNIGFKVIDNILESNNFPAFKSKYKGLASEGLLGDHKVLLLKPQTYMNESGVSVAAAAKFYKIAPDDIYVFHDELDLAAGKMRVKFGGGNAGHNGLRSMQARLGTADFWRVRLGIGHPGDKARVHGYVLSDFSKAERESWLQPFIDACAGQVDLLLQGADEDYMTAVAHKAPVPKAKKEEE